MEKQLFIVIVICTQVVWCSSNSQECTEGLIPGVCGHAGKCVECNYDEDCAQPTECDSSGRCGVDVHYLCKADSECIEGAQSPSAFCSGYQCYLFCETDMDCRTSVCGKSNVCEDKMCGKDGTCPEGWVISGMYCRYDPCIDEGKVTGRCGLAGSCVECMSDEQCIDGICDLSGSCKNAECTTDSDCGDGEKCKTDRCLKSCVSDTDCEANEMCVESVCVVNSCGENGICASSLEWKPVEGTRACERI
jgi:Cys-rich repeat protein